MSGRPGTEAGCASSPRPLMSPLADANFPDGLKSKPGRPGQPGTEDMCASSLPFLKSPLADALTSDALKRRSGRPGTATRCTSSPAQLRSPRATSDTTIVILDGSSISPLTDYPVDANRCETILAWPDQRVWSEMGRLATPDGGTNLIGLACTLCKVRMGGQDREAYRLRIARAARLRGDLGHQAPPQLDRPRVLAQFSRQTVDASWRHIDSSPA